MYINGYVTASSCDRGQPTFEHGKPLPLTIPALIQYNELSSRPEPHLPPIRRPCSSGIDLDRIGRR